ncbi:MAG: TolB-like 6-bladed beta-propeller domain-containing protein [Rikenellaceae bacterium]|nr:TolB-like 6-bladed beta-propeller domain-containing protein [Rikenellaceae bacterium]MCL2692153.1 TolB-like 6-bladed beta-propeller domain-containing protein [Rikenellaceae bacterium]
MRFAKILIFVGLLLVSCGKKDKFQLYGEVVKVAYPAHVEVLTGTALEVDGVYSGMMYVYDGVLLLNFRDSNGGFASLYDVDTGKSINNMILRQGRGPNEVVVTNPCNVFERDSSGICSWFFDNGRDLLILVNTQGEWLRTIDVSQFERSEKFFSIVLPLNDSLLIAYTPSIPISENGFSPIVHDIYNYRTGEKVRGFPIYNGYIAADPRLTISHDYLSPIHVLKPDRSKLGLVMECLRRVNILDLESGKVRTIELKDSPALNSVSRGKPIRGHYVRAACDDHYIFAVEGDYYGRQSVNERIPVTGKIHVFDWDGNFRHILQVNDDLHVFAVDPVRRMLYTKNYYEEITVYDIGFLYE